MLINRQLYNTLPIALSISVLFQKTTSHIKQDRHEAEPFCFGDILLSTGQQEKTELFQLRSPCVPGRGVEDDSAPTALHPTAQTGPLMAKSHFVQQRQHRVFPN